MILSLHQEVRSVRVTSRGTKLLALLLGMTLFAAACGSDKKSSSSSKSTNQNATTTAPVSVPTGGTLVVGAEQEPDCADWMGSCGGSSWGYWMMQVGTMPRAYDVVKENGKYVNKASNLLTGEPKLTTSPKQTVTYQISPKAVWSDGQPITSTDFKYTWNQVVTGNDIYDKTGYQDIESVDDSNPKTAVVTFKKNYADYQQLFGGGFGVFPSHILTGKDRDAVMKNGYTFSGGPWMIQKWDKTNQITMVPNPKYWGPKPKLDKVIFKIQADTSAEFTAFKSDQVSMIYPQPQLDAVDQINAGLLNTQKVISDDTGNFESLWLNNGKPPFNDKAVRQAVAYGIDRKTLVERLFGKLGVTEPLQVVNARIVSDYSDTQAFAGYTLNKSKVDSLLTGDGYKKGSDGIYAKNGQKLTFTVKSTAGNKRRELTEQVIQQMLKAVGIGMTIKNAEAGDLFGSILPKGDFQAGIYAQVLTALTPGNCTLFCSANIPTSPGFSGNNWTRVNVPGLDSLLEKVDGDLNQAARKTAAKQADKIVADNMVTLPIDPLPNILLWNNKVVGPINDNAVLGPFWNMNLWGVKG